MNCLEFRRQLTIDPMTDDGALAEHEQQCPDCAAFAREIRADEIKLRALLRSIQPPEGMADRIRLAAGFEQRAAVRRRWWYGAAAGVLMAIGVSMVSLFSTTLERGNVALAQSVIHHIEDEANHLHEAHPVSSGRVNYVFRRFGAELTTNIGPIHFAAECLMRERNGVHLVLPGQSGPITVFFMPGETADGDLEIRSPRFQGHLVPTDWGSIAVVGERGEVLEDLGRRIAAAVNWPDGEIAVSTLPTFRSGAPDWPLVAQQQDR
ncbi:MAG: DUF3379 family protein [Gammaproteobacteria bacterium]|nr:DUF3379 family protein [Gammaproteobacteria bacterium]